MRKLISLIIPCYNEEAGLGILYKALTEDPACPSMTSNTCS